MEAIKLLIEIVISFVCAVIVVCVHEYPKIICYKYLVHPLYKNETKVSFNPLKYMDPFGIISFMFLGAGWQKPFSFNTGRLRDKKKGLISITLIGLLSNLLLMAVLIPIFVSTFNQNYYVTKFLFLLILFNLAIVVVNLLPVPPFDMVKIIQALNPRAYFKFVQYEKVIQALFILFLASGFISRFVNIIIDSIFSTMIITGL